MNVETFTNVAKNILLLRPNNTRYMGIIIAVFVLMSIIAFLVHKMVPQRMGSSNDILDLTLDSSGGIYIGFDQLSGKVSDVSGSVYSLLEYDKEYSELNLTDKQRDVVAKKYYEIAMKKYKSDVSSILDNLGTDIGAAMSSIV